MKDKEFILHVYNIHRNIAYMRCILCNIRDDIDVVRLVRETCKRYRHGQIGFDPDRQLKNKGPVGQLGPVDPQITPCLE